MNIWQRWILRARFGRCASRPIHEDWIKAHRYLNMEMLREQRKELQLLEAA